MSSVCRTQLDGDRRFAGPYRVFLLMGQLREIARVHVKFARTDLPAVSNLKASPFGLLVCLFYVVGPRRWLGYDEVIEGSSGYRGHLPKRKFLIASAAGREGMEPFLVTRYYYCLLINVARARCEGASFGFSSVGVCENVVS